MNGSDRGRGSWARGAAACLVAALTLTAGCVPDPPTSASQEDAGTPPGVPTDLSAEAIDSDRVDLTWDAPPADSQDVDAFRVYRDGEVVGRPDRTSYSDSGLAAYTSYEYRVSAVNGLGLEGEKSDSVEVRTPDGSPPEPPAEVSARGTGPGAVEVSWEAASDPESGVAHYRVYRDGSLVAEPGGTGFEDTGLSTSTTYSYEVSAVNGAGLEGDRAGPESVETGGDDTPPTEPSDLEAKAEGPKEVELKWEAASDPESGVAHYRVYRDGSLVAEPGGTGFEDTGLSTSTTYSYEVSAVNGAGLEGERAGPRTAETDPDDTPPTEPWGLAAEAAGAKEVALEWEAASDPESGVAHYRVYRDGSLVAEPGGTGFEDTGLSTSTTYSYEVSAVNGAGLEGDRAGPESAETDPDDTPPTEPSDLEAKADGPTEVKLKWKAASDPESGVAHYRVYRDGFLVAEPEDTDFEDEGLEEETNYRYRVSAVNGAGLEGPKTSPEKVRTRDEEDDGDDDDADAAPALKGGAP